MRVSGSCLSAATAMGSSGESMGKCILAVQDGKNKSQTQPKILVAGCALPWIRNVVRFTLVGDGGVQLCME